MCSAVTIRCRSVFVRVRLGLATVVLPGLLSALPGCANLPDLELAKNDLQTGKEQAGVAQLQRLAEFGLPEAHLLLGRLYYYGKRVPLDPVLAEQHLLAASVDRPAAHYFLGQIYRKGYLGEHDPHKAVAHLLAAARSGSVNADYALATYFWENRGVRRKADYAYAFAQLAATGGHPKAQLLLTTIRQDSDADVQALGTVVAQREQQARRHPLVADVLTSSTHVK